MTIPVVSKLFGLIDRRMNRKAFKYVYLCPAHADSFTRNYGDGYCEKCGKRYTRIDNTHNLCSQCGWSVKKLAYCPSCGTKNPNFMEGEIR